MDLKDFISSTLKGIIDGTIDAQIYAKTKGACINPDYYGTMQNPRNIIDLGDEAVAPVQPISFELCIEENEKTGGKGDIKVISIGNEYSIQNANKVKFSIAVSLPTMSAPSRFIRKEE